MRILTILIIALSAVGLVALLKARWQLKKNSDSFKTLAKTFGGKLHDIFSSKTQAARAEKTQLISFLESLSQSLGAGTSLAAAVKEIINRPNSKYDWQSIATQLVSQLNLGVPLSEALKHWEVTSRSPAISKVVAVLSFGMVTSIGGQRAKAVDSLAANLRAELVVEEEIHSLSTQARMSGLVIAVLPVGFLFVLGAVDATYISFLFTTFIGVLCLCSGLTLDALGAYWMKKILTQTS